MPPSSSAWNFQGWTLWLLAARVAQRMSSDIAGFDAGAVRGLSE